MDRKDIHRTQNCFAICQLCGQTIQLNLLQSHLRTEHGLTYLEYKEELEWKRNLNQRSEKKTS